MIRGQELIDEPYQFNNLTHVLFDVSNTLIRPNPEFDETCRQFLIERNIQFDEHRIKIAKQHASKIYATHKANNPSIYENPYSERAVWAHFFSTLARVLAIEDTLDFLEIGYEIYDYYNPSGHWIAFDDVHSSLQTLKDQGLRLVAVSDFGKSLPENLINIDLKKYFDSIFVSTLVGKAKHNSELYNYVLESLNLHPDQCIMIGDNYTLDIVSAAKMKIRGILIDRSGTNMTLKSNESFHVVNSLSELVRMLSVK
jgi:HAD superfamily hydrolase (TIGR01549 family)